MKSILRVVLLTAVLAVFGAAAARAAGIGLSPIGGWESTWNGYEGAKGLAYFDFTTNNTVTGYVFEYANSMFFEFEGEWQIDGAGQVTGWFTHEGETNALTAFVPKAGKIGGVIGTPEPEPVEFKGKTAGSFQDAAGTWRGTVKSGSEEFPIEFVATPMPGQKGAYNFTGTAGSEGTDILEGGFLLTSKGKVYAGGSSDDGGSSGSVELYMTGKISPTKGMVLKGYTSNPEDPKFTITVQKQ
jgi:hypothetical protein